MKTKIVTVCHKFYYSPVSVVKVNISFFIISFISENVLHHCRNILVHSMRTDCTIILEYWNTKHDFFYDTSVWRMKYKMLCWQIQSKRNRLDLQSSFGAPNSSTSGGQCSVFFKIQPNNVCQEAGMNFGAKSHKAACFRVCVCSVTRAVVTEMETSIHRANKQW